MQEKLDKLEIQFNYNHILIEELYTIISTYYKTRNHSKNKVPDDVLKTLRAAIKLEKEIDSTTKTVIEDGVKENSSNFNSKESESVCESVRNSNKNTIKYYNINHVQV